ncbi:hypothetical protein [Actinacidiphila sp. ITFR-21]|uniref:hypothetical protein n=1 Tax=Actinacidiphila sp. ITFR-21 TaxID=3075199 RepID=UPI002889AC03|nr:hypothetical protein [Streptomyces sp. ITFR-21]WNI17244.1 hypothetical protein RLT57_18150 [Streptomyces sp. ITFR-21]
MSVQPAASPELLRWGPKNLPVPYAATWSAETSGTGSGLIVRPHGIGYRDETPADRDTNGVLWSRTRQSPGVGRPDYRSMHPRRQHRTMLHKLCQVCGGPADRTSRGWLFLLPRPEGTESRVIEGVRTTKPPICRPCAALALRHCPHLTAPVFVRSRKPRVWGVYGDMVTPTGEFAPEDSGHYLPYGHPLAPWFLASQSVVELNRSTQVALDQD